MIKNDAERKKVQARIRQLRAFLKDKIPGAYPKEEQECIDLFDQLDEYFRSQEKP